MTMPSASARASGFLLLPCHFPWFEACRRAARDEIVAFERELGHRVSVDGSLVVVARFDESGKCARA